MKKTVAIIQARLGSTRLLGKVLKIIGDRPMLQWVVDRAKRTIGIDEVVVATTESVADDPVAQWCSEKGINCFRGSEHDVLDRYYQAAKAFHADIVLRITADCPLIDPLVIERGLQQFHAGGADYVSNTLRYTYPDGLDVEIFSFEALSCAWEEAQKPSEREHVTPYMRNSGKFKVMSFENDVDLGPRQMRWTVDEECDLEYVRAIVACFSGRDDFRLNDILSAIDAGKVLVAQSVSVSNEGYYKSLYEQAIAEPRTPLKIKKSQEFFERVKKVIPGGAQTFSKGYTQHVVGVSPLFLEKGAGSHVWDVDGNEYIDYIQGLLPNILGYAHPEVDEAFYNQARQGHSFSLAHPVECQLAERLCEIIPCAEMVRFGKNGSDATAGAVRIARAYTGRERVACCGYHGWQDWYIGSTARHAGVPQGVRSLTHPFPYNDLAGLEKILEEHAGEFAGVIMEPANFVEPLPGYLEGVKQLAHKYGAVLIFDEICTGFHRGLGGAQRQYGVTPDLACFGKAMGNGYPISCVCGKAEIMKICEEVFFSFTFGGEVASMAAALKVIQILKETDALLRMRAMGRKIKDGFSVLSRLSGVDDCLELVGDDTWSLIKFKSRFGGDGLLERSLLQQEMVKRGILMLVTHNMTAAHRDSDVEKTLESYAEVLKLLGQWLADPRPEKFLQGKKIEPVFKVR